MANEASIVIPVELDDKQAQAELNKLNRDIQKTQNEISKSESTHNTIADQLRKAQEEAINTYNRVEELRNALAESDAVLNFNVSGQEVDATQYAEALEKHNAISEELRQQEALLAKQEAEAQKLEAQDQAVLDKLKAQTSELQQQQTQAGLLQEQMVKTGSVGLENIKNSIEGGTESFKKGLGIVLKYGIGIRSLFVLFRKLRTSIAEGIKSFAEYDSETQSSINGLKASLSGLKASWGAAFAPILNAVAPILNTLINMLTAAANAIQRFFAILSGKSSIKKAVADNNNLAKSISGAGGAAEEAKKQLAGFDELTRLEDNSSGGGGGGAAEELAFDEEEITPKRWEAMVRDSLAAIETAAGAFLLGLGAVLTFSGANIPLGLGLMAIGAATMAHGLKDDWSTVPANVASVLAQIGLLVGVSLMEIGLILLCSGNIGMGLGLLIAGLVGVAAVAFSFDKVPTEVQGVITRLMTVASLGLVAIGVALLCMGIIPLGIGMIVAGGALGATAMALNWGSLTKKTEEVLNNVKAKWQDFKVKLSETVRGLRENITQDWNELHDKLSEKAPGLMAVVDGVFSFFSMSAKEKMNLVKTTVKDAVDRIKEYFNFNWQLPHINVPHLEVAWEALGANSILSKFLGITALPHFSINWYAKGGIVDGATLIGAGEAGKEAIIPLERNTEWISKVANDLADILVGNSFMDRFASAIANVPMPAMASGSVIPPMITVNGIGEDFGANILNRIDALSERIQALADRDFVGYSTIEMDKRKIGEAVTRYQREQERSGR